MPKSSSDSRTPISARRSNALAAGADIAAPSLTSSVRRRGSTLDVASARVTSSTIEWSSRQRGETFTATDTSWPDATHCASCASAVSRTQLVNGLITFVSSASEMNRSGGRRPSRGWFQRTRASSA